MEENICRRLAGRTGLASELRVAADLLIKGYEVYGAFRVGNTHDFLISKGNVFLSVEVKTAWDLKERPHMWKNKPDVLVLCDYSGKILYISENKI